MNTVLRAELDQVAIPADAGGQLASCCVVNDDGCWRLAWLVGTEKQPFGDCYPTVKAAAAASARVNARAANV